MLKDTIEANLGHSICIVDVTLRDKMAANGYTSSVLDAAMLRVGLEKAHPYFQNAADMVLLYHNNMARKHRTGMTLIVDASYSGLNLDVTYLAEDGSPDGRSRQLRNIFDTAVHRFGDVDAPLSGVIPRHKGQAIREALSYMADPTIDRMMFRQDAFGWRETGPDHIITFGDNRQDVEFRAALDELFPDTWLYTMVYDPAGRGPVFGAALSALRLSNTANQSHPWPKQCCSRSLGRACPVDITSHQTRLSPRRKQYSERAMSFEGGEAYIYRRGPGCFFLSEVRLMRVGEVGSQWSTAYGNCQSCIKAKRSNFIVYS